MEIVNDESPETKMNYKNKNLDSFTASIVST